MNSTTRRQLLAEIASLYYKEKLTQSQIGRNLGYSRSAISRLLTEAERAGIVEVTIKYPLSRDLILERYLKDKYHLDAVYVVESGKTSYQSTLQVLGQMGALYLEQSLKDNMVIGIGWGTSLAETVNHLPYLPLADMQVVQVLGSVGGRSDPQVDGPGVASNLASRMSAAYHILHSPLFLDSEEACETLKAQKQIAQTLDEGINSDIVLLGIGTVEIDPLYSSIYRSGFMSESDIMEVQRLGSLANFCGLLLDQDGQIIDSEFNRRMMAADLRELRKCAGKIIGIAGGETKSRAIQSVLNGKWLDVLITDTAAVHPILEIPPSYG